jgi:hypothetical protein
MRARTPPPTGPAREPGRVGPIIASPRCVCIRAAHRLIEVAGDPVAPLQLLLERQGLLIHVDFPDGRQLVTFLVTTRAYANYPFVPKPIIRERLGRKRQVHHQ